VRARGPFAYSRNTRASGRDHKQSKTKERFGDKGQTSRNDAKSRSVKDWLCPFRNNDSRYSGPGLKPTDGLCAIFRKPQPFLWGSTHPPILEATTSFQRSVPYFHTTLASAFYPTYRTCHLHHRLRKTICSSHMRTVFSRHPSCYCINRHAVSFEFAIYIDFPANAVDLKAQRTASLRRLFIA